MCSSQDFGSSGWSCGPYKLLISQRLPGAFYSRGSLGPRPTCPRRISYRDSLSWKNVAWHWEEALQKAMGSMWSKEWVIWRFSVHCVMLFLLAGYWRWLSSVTRAVLQSVSMQLTIPVQTQCFVLIFFQSHTIFVRSFLWFDKILFYSKLVLKPSWRFQLALACIFTGIISSLSSRSMQDVLNGARSFYS